MSESVDVADVVAVITAELGLGDGEVTADSTIDDVESWDSLGHLRVCMALEQRFGVTIPMEDIADLRSVPAIVAKLSAPA
ncbi:MAG: acyl carrier protein [Acidimicrobiales bacterium]